MQALISLLEKRLGVAWSDVIAWLQKQNGQAELEARLATGDMNSIVKGVEDAAARFAAETHGTYITAGQRTAASLDEQLPDKLVRFDVVNTRAVARAQANQYELIQGFTAEQREVTRNILIDGARNGANPLELARDIRSGLGLTPSQDAAVRSYRRALETGDYSNALGRALSSGHSDRAIRAAQDGGRLTDAQINTAVARYRENYITHRAEVIARTEVLRNVHQGNEDAYAQAIARGDIDADQLQREWHAGPSTRYARPDHRALSGTRVAYGEDFVTRHGVHLRYPGDERAPASETVQCRCTISTRIVA